MSQKPTLLAIVNPKSGTTSPKQKEQLQHFLSKHATNAHFVPEVVVTDSPGHATRLAEQAAAGGVERVIAVGGDGTINETARGLRHSRTSLGIVPIGSGNGLARHLRLPLDPQKAVMRALLGKPVLIDTGDISGHLFCCTAGMGFEAYVAHAFARQDVRGLATYMRVAINTFQQYKPQPYVIDGQPKHLFSLTFANAGQFGNNAWMAPQANIADGWLDICELQAFPVPQAAIIGWQLFNKSLNKSPYWHSQPIKRSRVEGPKPLLIHADGEPLILPHGIADVQIWPGSLLVVV